MTPAFALCPRRHPLVTFWFQGQSFPQPDYNPYFVPNPRMVSQVSTDLKAHLAALFASALEEVAPANHGGAIVLDRPKQAGHGDYACSIALQLAKPLKRNPREIAQALGQRIARFARSGQGGGGWRRVRQLVPEARRQSSASSARSWSRATHFGRIHMGRDQKVQVEFVSANPTGPLHVGHGRGAAYGASLANVLAAAGFDVTREFYVNDAGRQMDILALSTWLRYLELQEVVVAFPSNAYQGDYVREMAAGIAAAHGTRYVRGAHQVLDGVPPLEDDPEAHLDALIANAKKVLGRGLRIRARLCAHRAARRLPQRSARIRCDVRPLVLGALAVR